MAVFTIAQNPDDQSRLPYLLKIPLKDGEQVLLATRERWPATKDLYCHAFPHWPDEAKILEEIPIEHAYRQGAAVHLTLRRQTRRRSLFIWTKGRGRTLIFWRSAATMRTARPGIRVPSARALEQELTIAIDQRERYAWRFSAHKPTLEKRTLPIGDYAIIEGTTCTAAVERKSITDLATSLSTGQIRLALQELSRLRHAAVVIEGRVSDLIKYGKEAKVRSGWLMNLIAALQVEFPSVVWMFAETRSLAEDYAYRFLAAAAHTVHEGGTELEEVPTSTVRDRSARRQIALAGARDGITWTSSKLAKTLGVSVGTAILDLKALVERGDLVSERSGRALVYRLPGPHE